MTHSNFQPARKGLTQAAITAAKVLRQMRNGPQGELKVLGQAARQLSRMKYSDQGDFTRCYRGGFY